jgi:cbb3-type cytochrome oxidase maturation protein
MNIILVLIPVTLLVVIVGVVLFFWAVNHQQFDDLDSPGVLPLLEDDPDQGAIAGRAPPSQADAAPPPR